MGKISSVPGDTLRVCIKTAEYCLKSLLGVIEKITEFCWRNKSRLFFVYTIWETYHRAPEKAMEYLSFWGYSFKTCFVQGVALGTLGFAVANIFGIRNLSRQTDNRINYLLGIASLCNIYINPTTALITNIMVAGVAATKEIYCNLLNFEDTIKDKPEKKLEGTSVCLKETDKSPNQRYYILVPAKDPQK
jgi:hypothetical protein